MPRPARCHVPRLRRFVGRRGFLPGALAVGAGAALAACTSNSRPPAAAPAPNAAAGGGATPTPGTKAVTIGFSAPAADHGWIAAIAKNAQAQAAKYSDVTFKPVSPTNDINRRSPRWTR